MIEYKRYANWDDLCSEEKKVLDKLTAEGKLRPMGVMERRAILVEQALNRLGKDGWKISFIHRDAKNNAMLYGIFMCREVSKSPELPKLENLIGPEPGNTEEKLKITP